MSQFYNQIAEKYDFIFPLSPAHKTFFASELHGKTILDVGAATGNLTAYLSSQGYEVTAIDLSERLIAKAVEKGVTVQQLNMLAIDELPTFDNIVCIGNTLPHLDSKTSVQLFLQKAYGQLTQGGKLVLQLVNFQKYFAQQQGDYLGNLPLIENDKVKFERYYYLNEEGKIRFKTILDDTIKNEELLQPIFADQLTEWLTQIGFQAINLYGNFKKDPFDKEKSMALIVTAVK
ncbi:class I SAM-dependent methyltransferase [Capnocytophaga granulosa]|uniref:class I SAM-dependent methyltransferase n=1 Tax=Capnocytophaga granulosa TaxID=45242 RepID=UPI0028D09907|nr:class I SAM-dependent methyltransferase [Capnocytophaga granulosa]